MGKKEFLDRLRKGLSGLSQEEIKERLTFYSEMIDDRMEEGLSEEDAVQAVGSAEDIAAQITVDTKPKRRLKAWEIVLLALGSPIWLSLLIAAFAVIVSLYASLWSVIISLWAVFGALAGCALGIIAAGIGFIVGGNGLTGIAMIGAGFVCAGLAIFLFYGCKTATIGTLLLTKKLVLWTCNRFIRKEAA